MGSYTINGKNLICETIPAEGTLLSNFAITQNDIQLTINKRDLVVSPVSAEFTYDGDEHKLTEYTYDKNQLCPGHILDPDNNPVTWANNSATEVNDPGQEVTITKVVVTNANAQTEATKDVSANYNIIHSAKAILLIKKADMYIDITGNTLGADEENPLYYTGKTQTVSEYKVSVDYAKTSATLKEEFDASKISPSPQKCIAQGSSVGTHTMKIIKEDGSEVDFGDTAN
ncbi:MAG: hypothetical protein Q4F54_04005 [Coriobacteriia bacterium]|nr:hypothetical protein [Coriobacteriia bacterium]